jgi:hypothetical protein
MTGCRGKLSDFVQFEDNTILWTASLVLLQHLQRPENRATLAGKRVLELGSGLGHLGVGLSHLGAHITCTERPQELAALQASVQRQTAARGSGNVPVLEAALALFGRSSDSSSQQSRTDSSQEQPAGSVEVVALEWGEAGYSRCDLHASTMHSFAMRVRNSLQSIVFCIQVAACNTAAAAV